MEVWRGWPAEPVQNSTGVAIGNFDGVHLGHRRVIGHLRSEASRRGLRSLVLTFEPHPSQVLLGTGAPALLTLPERRLQLLAETGVDGLAVLPFDGALLGMSAEDFAERLLNLYRVKLVAVGFNFSFGRGGKASAEDLRRLLAGEAEVIIEPPVMLRGEVVSSTRIRSLLGEGDVARAALLLGRDFDLAGRVVPGDRRGRELGFPTANLAVDPRQLLPAPGVYAVHVGLAERVLPGMANLGRQPTFGGKGLRLEVHIFDFSDDLYGLELTVSFAARLRGERRFPSAEALREQLSADMEAARRLLSPVLPRRMEAEGGKGRAK